MKIDLLHSLIAGLSAMSNLMDSLTNLIIKTVHLQDLLNFHLDTNPEDIHLLKMLSILKSSVFNDPAQANSIDNTIVELA